MINGDPTRTSACVGCLREEAQYGCPSSLVLHRYYADEKLTIGTRVQKHLKGVTK